MRVSWEISEDDVRRVKAIIGQQKNNPFVLARAKRNLAPTKPVARKATFWRSLVGCLMTTQQRSGPGSAVSLLIKTKPFPLSYAACRKKRNLQVFATRVISKFGGIRRGPTLGREIAENFRLLEGGLWPRALSEVGRLSTEVSREVEVEVATFIDQNLVGFGPKQARNLLLDLGLSRYEIPIDSRVSKWLREFGFPASLSPAALSDPDYYHFISTAVVELCDRSGVVPCMLDAAIFSSFDTES